MKKLFCSCFAFLILFLGLFIELQADGSCPFGYSGPYTITYQMGDNVDCTLTIVYCLGPQNATDNSSIFICSITYNNSECYETVLDNEGNYQPKPIDWGLFYKNIVSLHSDNYSGVFLPCDPPSINSIYTRLYTGGCFKTSYGLIVKDGIMQQYTKLTRCPFLGDYTDVSWVEYTMCYKYINGEYVLVTTKGEEFISSFHCSTNDGCTPTCFF